MEHNLSINVSEKSKIIGGQFSVKEIVEKIRCNIKAKKVFLVSDSNVFPIYGDELIGELKKYFEVDYHNILAGEESKNFYNVEVIFGKIFDFGLTRSDAVIYLGGGVVGDLTAFVASIYMRGVDLVALPTSLLAMCDSSIGGKCGVNTAFGKNTIGAIVQPKLVIANVDYLKSLPGKYFSDGMAEVIKYGYIFDKEFLRKIACGCDILDIVNTSIMWKVNTVNVDVKDKGERMKLNFGHTIGHCIEKLGNYKSFGHGEAVAIGMDFALSFSKISSEEVESFRALLAKYNLPHSCKYGSQEIFDLVFRDKKVLDKELHFIALNEVGDSKIEKVSAERIFNALKEWKND